MAIFNSYVKLPEGLQGFSRAILIEGSPTRSGTDDSSVEIFFASIWNHYHGINHHERNECDGRMRLDPNHEPT